MRAVYPVTMALIALSVLLDDVMSSWGKKIEYITNLFYSI